MSTSTDVYQPIPVDGLEQRIYDRVSITDSGCWKWSGGMDHTVPYVVTNHHKIDIRRMIWQQENEPLRTRRLHRQCDERRCINPDHFVAR